MAGKAMRWRVSACVALSCVIYIVTTIISLNCVAQKQNDCARAAGFTAAVFACVLVLGCACVMLSSRGSSGSSVNG